MIASENKFKDILSTHDSVIVLSLSDFKNERPSNRWHYSRRLNRFKEVFFVNLPDGKRPNVEIISSESSTYSFHLLTPSNAMTYDEILKYVKAYLNSLGFNRPLIWVYNSFYQNLDTHFEKSFVVYHATEDFFDEERFPDSISIRNSIIRISEDIDFWIFCSMGLKSSYESKVRIRNYIYLPNGVDFKHFFSTDDHDRDFSIAYQGSIDNRIDFELVLDVVNEFTELQFHFYGPIQTTNRTWKKISKLPNVKLFNNVDLDTLQFRLNQDFLGWIPFRINDYHSNAALPLKYFEYLASGIPVISTPMYQIVQHNPLYIFASNKVDFIEEIRKIISIVDRNYRIKLRSIAEKMDYEKRFFELLEFRVKQKEKSTLTFLYIIDSNWMHIPTVREHLVELATNLGGYFICLDIHFSNLDLINDQVFDILIVHYSVRFTVPHNPDFINKIKRFAGKKLLFIQDDYDNTLFALKQIKQCNFDMIATSAPQHILNLIYPKKHFPFTHVASVLSGYVSQEMQMRKRFWTNLDLRAFYFVYRGRELPPRYGKLGADKSLIGKLFSDRLKNSNIFFDISSSANDRVYESWLNFLSKGKSTLITESGSSIIDWNGDLLALDDLGSGFQSSKTLSSKELENPWNCISPKAFEAISVGTILVGFQGHYSGVLKEGVHFLRIERDLSNLDEIINLLQDGIVAEQFRDRVFFDIILNTKYTYIALAQTIKELFFEIGHRQQALNQRCITPIEFYQDASSNWNMKIEKGDLSKRLRIRGANPNFIPFYVIEKRQLFSDYLSALNSLKSWKKVRFSLFKFALNKSFSRKIFFFFGRKSSKMNRYLHVIR